MLGEPLVEVLHGSTREWILRLEMLEGAIVLFLISET